VGQGGGPMGFSPDSCVFGRFLLVDRSRPQATIDRPRDITSCELTPADTTADRQPYPDALLEECGSETL
jgi:hypothetical protein